MRIEATQSIDNGWVTCAYICTYSVHFPILLFNVHLSNYNNSFNLFSMISFALFGQTTVRGWMDGWTGQFVHSNDQSAHQFMLKESYNENNVCA